MYKTGIPLDISKLEQGQSRQLQQLMQGLQGQCNKDSSGKTLWTQEFTACGKSGGKP